MQLELNKDNFIIGYTTSGTQVNAVEVGAIPKAVIDDYTNYQYINGQFVFNDSYATKQIEIESAKIELAEIKKWFDDTDYIPLKVIRGNWSANDTRYIEYCAEYNHKKARKDTLELILLTT